MKRYIDANELIKEIYRTANRSDLGEFSPAYLDWKAVVSIIKDAPTADVVSRAEVEDWQAIAEGYQKMFEDSYEQHQAELAKTKAEIRRETLAEIEAEITESLNRNYKRRTTYYTKERYKKEDRGFINAVSGKIAALQDVMGFIAILKEKYSEGAE